MLALRTVTYCTENEETPIFAAAKTGYVVLRIEPGDQGRQSLPSSLRYGASSAFPTLTGPMALAAGLAACLRALWPFHEPTGSQEVPATTGRLDTGDGVDSFGTTRPTMTLEGPLLTLEGPTMPAHY
nr:hypothetical protein [uncultured bacterium]